MRNKFYDDTHCPYAHFTLAQLAPLTISIPLTVTHRILSGAGWPHTDEHSGDIMSLLPGSSRSVDE
ncbi:hypothetical protein KPSB59_3220016 [Klebsiella quasipneumoniae subsp. quasipneumoniae]|nr:hypothetical protein KPSB59_3220016 [Klebsiella quasipneumoniae subsp. quasipneumoniae]